MFLRIANVGRWASIPVLLFASLFSGLAESYALSVEIAIWASVIFLVQHAVRSGDHIWAAALGVVVSFLARCCSWTRSFSWLHHDDYVSGPGDGFPAAAENNRAAMIGLLLILLCAVPSASAYSVLTHAATSIPPGIPGSSPCC